MNKPRIYYVWDENLIAECDRLPAVIGRASMVHGLITAYGLLDQLKIVHSSPASYSDLKLFHSELYLDHIKNFTEVDEDYMSTTLDEEYGFGYDCPPVSDMFKLVSTIAGGSITAAKSIVLGLADVAINWCGGWHHAQRFGAEGFCYINDIVLAIETLRRKFDKVLYIDLDVHHGNGVQDAYNLSKSVFTLSIHKYEPGFYPGTGDVSNIGTLAGTGYSCNIPLHAGYSDNTMNYVFDKVFSKLFSLFEPSALVVQCGADALAHDPHGGANLSIEGYKCCLRKIMDKQKPMLLVGGGGYNFQNAARLWTALSALVTEVDLDESIPEHEHWPKYGPDYMLAIAPSLVRDTNKSNLDVCLTTITNNLEKYLAKSDSCEDIEIMKKSKYKKQNRDIQLANNEITKPEVDIGIIPHRSDPKSVDIYDFTDED